MTKTALGPDDNWDQTVTNYRNDYRTRITKVAAVLRAAGKMVSRK